MLRLIPEPPVPIVVLTTVWEFPAAAPVMVNAPLPNELAMTCAPESRALDWGAEAPPKMRVVVTGRIFVQVGDAVPKVSAKMLTFVTDVADGPGEPAAIVVEPV